MEEQARMDITTISTEITGIIGALGFPIFFCIKLFNENREQRQAHKEEVMKLCETQKAEVEGLCKAITENSLLLSRLIEREDMNEQANC